MISPAIGEHLAALESGLGMTCKKNSGSHKYLWTKLMCGVYERALAILIFAALNDARSDALATIVMSIRLVIR